MFVVGDLHGHLDVLKRLLHSRLLIDEEDDWTGGGAVVCFMGDLFDRGPDGLGCLRLIQKLEQQANAVGGRVTCLLGNHEILLVAAKRFQNQKVPGFKSTILELWKRNGGRDTDLEITPAEIAWLSSLDAMRLEGDALLIHCDSTFYVEVGSTVQEVNRKFSNLFDSHEITDWSWAIDITSRRQELDHVEAAEAMLARFGGQRIIHGHTPIPYQTGLSAKWADKEFVYNNGLCVNVDGGIYMGSPGFIFQLDEQ